MSGNSRDRNEKKKHNVSGRNNKSAESRKTQNESELKSVDESVEEKTDQEVKADAGEQTETKEAVKKDIKGTGKFGLGHKKTKRAAIFYIFEDIADAFAKVKKWCVENYRTSIIGAIALVLLVIVVVSIVRNAHISKLQEQVSNDQPAVTESGIDIPDEPLLENAYEYINQFIAKYYEACANGDVEAYMSMRSYTDETEQVRMQKKSDYVEYYQNVTCYTKPGPVENSYLVYVYYEVKFHDIDTVAPGLNTLYVCTNDTGELYVFSGDVDSYVSEYMQLVSTQQDVKDLFNRVQVTYNDAVDSDEDLKAFLEDLAVNLKNDVGEGIAQIEAQNPSTDVADASDESNEDTASGNIGEDEKNAGGQENQGDTEQNGEGEQAEESEQPQTTVTETVRTTDLVNVRGSASAESTKLGAVNAGTRLTRLEEMANGWSRVEFDGGEGYIKSEYLEVVETATGTVTTLENVNVRAEASETAQKLGMAYKGTTLELIETQDDGWSRVIFKGQTAYVKSEYVQ